MFKVTYMRLGHDFSELREFFRALVICIGYDGRLGTSVFAMFFQ